MKKFSKIFVCILASIVAVGCSDDSVEKGMNWNEGEHENNLAYLDVNVLLPTQSGSRSETTGPNGESDTGVEIGKDYENNVNSLMLVLASTDNGYIAHSIVGGLSTENNNPPSTQTYPSVSATATITRSSISQLYQENGSLKSAYTSGVKVYVFCNPTQDLTNRMAEISFGNKEWIDATCEVIEAVGSESNTTVWKEKSFLMSNADDNNLRLLPNEFDSWDKYANYNNPFKLTGENENGINNNTAERGPIKVERSVARFDFRDGSPETTPAYTYSLEESTLTGLQVQLVNMAMVNMNKKFYYLRRISNNENGYSNPVICGGETRTNYVVDWDAAYKAGTFTSASLHEHFNYPFFNKEGNIEEGTREQWYNYNGSMPGNGTPDEDDSWNTPKEYGDYYIWRYVTENTIPSADQQKNGISTGVVFKGKLLAGTSTRDNLKDAIAGKYSTTTVDNRPTYTYTVDNKHYPILYVFQNTLYVGWNDEIIASADSEGEGSPLYAAAYDKSYNGKGEKVENGTMSINDLYQILAKASNSAEEETALAAFRKAATSAGFTLYQASSNATQGAGYYFYYYYWNRHNDNSRALIMGPMEFAVVRNNVYKLAVTSIRRLGHPRIGDNDPDKPTPETPDEKGDVYLTVDVQVLPWVVRINNIEF